MKMNPFDYTMPLTRIVSGPESLNRLPTEVQALGVTRLLLVHGQRVAGTQLLASVRDRLGPRIVGTYAEVIPHSSVDLVTRGAELARSLRIDGFVSVGGGSSSDTAKGINILLAEGGALPEHASTFVPPDKFYPKELSRPKLPLIALPTTCSGAEITPGLGIRNEQGVKLLFWDVKLASRLVVLGPECLAETPLPIIMTTAMNGLAHCIEGLYSRQRNPISDALALQGIRLFNTALPRLADRHDDPEALAMLQAASALGGMVISNARVGIHHAICHCLGARLNVSHGVANAVMLPYAMRFNLDVAAPRLALAAEAMGVAGNEQAAAEKAVEAVFALQARIGVPQRLRDAGVDRTALQQIARDTMQDRGLYFNPKPVAHAEVVLRLLEEAW